MSAKPPIVGAEGRTSCSDDWEAAYLAFETPAEAKEKIAARLRRFGASTWSRDTRVVELFCGSGFGLDALTEMGFTSVEGMDLSAELASRYEGPARCFVGDCRKLPFEDASRDRIVVHGGLHHLESLEDIETVLAEVARVLTPDGELCFVEPWRTPFLRFVLFVSKNPLARRAWGKLDAFQTMVEHERVTYEHWLDRAVQVEVLLDRYFRARIAKKRWGGLTFVGTRRVRKAN